MVVVCEVDSDDERANEADLDAENDGAWKVSLRSMRWCTMWKCCRKSSVLCEGWGKRDGVVVFLYIISHPFSIRFARDIPTFRNASC